MSEIHRHTCDTRIHTQTHAHVHTPMHEHTHTDEENNLGHGQDTHTNAHEAQPEATRSSMPKHSTPTWFSTAWLRDAFHHNSTIQPALLHDSAPLFRASQPLLLQPLQPLLPLPPPQRPPSASFPRQRLILQQPSAETEQKPAGVCDAGHHRDHLDTRK